MNPVLSVVLRVLGIGALVAGGIAVAAAVIVGTVFLAPLLFWIAWNVLDFASAVGLPELGFWGIVLVTLFLVLSWGGKVIYAAVVFLVDPSWFDGAARVHWPEPTFRNFVSVAILALLVTRPHTHAARHDRRRREARRYGWSNP